MTSFDSGAIYLNEIDTLVVADLHLGKHTERNPRTYPEPTTQRVLSDLRELVSTYNPAIIVLNGDTFHHRVPTQESSEAVREFIQEFPDTVFTVGNHEESTDTITTAIEDATVAVEYELEGFVFSHGHRTPAMRGDTLVIGHVHPAITLDTVLQKCYIRGVWNNTTVYVLPAFNYDVTGSDITQSDYAGICPVFSEMNSIEYMPLGGDTFTEL